MARRSIPLAKLACPRSHAPLIRERLHVLLKESSEHEVTWVSAPPGGGKTTLLASWLRAQKRPSLWYQMDEGDADPATFFYYLRLAFTTYNPRIKAPPLLTPEYAADVPGFTRRFFRALFHHLPLSAVCVFDNYHELPPDSAVHEIFATAVREIPPGMRVVIISRSDPPGTLAQALARDQVAYLGWDALRLTSDESCAIATRRGAVSTETAQRIHELCDGWPAGLTLMLERLQRDGEMASLDRGEVQESVFGFFADQILRSVDDETRQVLLATAFVPRMSAAQARALSGIESAGSVLESLYRRQLFVEQSGNDGYQYHPLFRNFLRSEAARTFAGARLADLILRSARLLANLQHWPEAFELHAQVEDWPSATALLMEAAPGFLRQGRQQTLQTWIQRLPDTVRDAEPWIGYWAGRSWLARDPRTARHSFEAVHAAIRSEEHAHRRLLASSAVLEALYYEFSDFKAMDPWIPRVAEHIANGVAGELGPEDELRVVSTFLMAASYRAPEHELLERCAARTAELVTQPLDDNLRVGAISMLFAYAVMALDEQAESVARREAARLLESPEVTTLRAAFCLAAEGYLHYTLSRYESALGCFDRCDAIAEAHGLTEHTSMSRLWRGLTQRRMGILAEAEKTIARILTEPSQPTGQRAAVFSLLKSVVAHDLGHFQSALTHALHAQDIAERSGQFNGGTLLVIVTANVAVGAGQYELAEQSLRRIRERVQGPMTLNYLAPIALNESWLAHRRGDDSLRDERLREALGYAGDRKARMRMRWYPNALSELLPVALSQRIEPATARELAREFGIRPNAVEPSDWPWPVRVRLLGSLQLEIDGAAAAFGRKTPRKTLQLLAAIIAFGGTDVPEQWVMDALWPHSDGDAAYRALTTASRRLRALLRRDHAVRLSGGLLSLDRGCVWSDVWAFERAASTDLDSEVVLDLYRGPFLDQEDAAWAIGPRHRLRVKFAEVMTQTGRRLEREALHEKALGLYCRATEVEPTVEGFYQGQMRCHASLQRPGEAMTVYRCLSQLLASTRGEAPSAQSRLLIERILAG